MKCPVCTATDLLMSERQGVEIDYCPQCRGVWLDRGELDKVIERSNASAPPPPPPPAAAAAHGYREENPFTAGKHGHGYEGHRDSHYGHGAPHKKKSLLNELFDF